MRGKKAYLCAIMLMICVLCAGICYADDESGDVAGNSIQFNIPTDQPPSSSDSNDKQTSPAAADQQSIESNNRDYSQPNGNAFYATIYQHVLSTAPYLGRNWAALVTNSIMDSCNRYGVDPLLATALFTQESGFNPNALSQTGALGIAQLMPSTAASLGLSPQEAWSDPAANIDAGVHYLAIQLDRFSYAGNWQNTYAIAAYNAGPGALVNGLPPYLETVNHVNSIRAIYIRLMYFYNVNSAADH